MAPSGKYPSAEVKRLDSHGSMRSISSSQPLQYEKASRWTGSLFTKWISSHLFRHQASKNGWKPPTLRIHILGSFIAISLSIIALLEFLHHKYSENGGLAFASDTESLSTSSTFLFLYLPTVLAVLYSMLWSWVDLDTKRLEPWFQLSKSSGAIAEDSLLLQYPFDFLPFIPITAFRRRHWAVFLTGTVMLLIFWIITPLQSAIFNTGTAIRSIPAAIGTSAILPPLESQITKLNAKFLNTAYGISWLNQKLPAFTTSELAVLPFKPTSARTFESTSERWSAMADIYSTNLSCSPANVNLKSNGYTFDNGRGCSVSDMVLSSTLNDTGYMISYIGYYDNAILDLSLQNPNCSTEHSDNFLALWASEESQISPGFYSNLTALFCQPSYHIQRAQVTVNASDGAVARIVPASANISTSSVNTLFNTSNFEYLLGVGIQPQTQRADYPDTAPLEQFPDIENYDIAWPVSNMVGFAVGLNSVPIADLASPRALQQAFEKAHQLLFASAISTLTEESTMTGPVDIRDGIRQQTLGAIIMVRAIAIVVESALALIIMMCACFWYYSHSRPNKLVRDPASIADIMSIVQKESICEEFKDNGTLTAEDLDRTLSNRKFYLAADPENEKIVYLRSNTPKTGGVTSQSKDFATSANVDAFAPVQPFELRMSVGVTLLGILLGSIAIIVFLYIHSRRRNGIPLPSTNPVVLSLLENYVPTVFATLLEPVWVILNRVLCLLQPFDELRKGNARFKSTVGAKYTSLPPQLVAGRALEAGNFLLAAVCFVAISMNVLAVSLTGLIIEGNTIIQLPLASSQNLTSNFSGLRIRLDSVPVDYFAHLYHSMANLTRDTPLPAWIDHEFAYLPFEIGTIPISSGSVPINTLSLQGSTTGIGASLDCIELSSLPNDDNTIVFDPIPDQGLINFYTSHQLSNGTRVNCFGSRISNSDNQSQCATNNFTIGQSALEVAITMAPLKFGSPAGLLTNQDDGGFCSSQMVFGWARLGPETSTELVASNLVNNTNSNRDLSYTFLSCTPSIQMATFDVNVDPHGRILNSRRTSDFVLDPKQAFLNSSDEASLLLEANELMTPRTPDGFKWHNDSFTSDWTNSLIGYKLESISFVDPAAPVPTAANATNTIQEQYKQLFALLLGLNTHVFSPSPEKTSTTIEVIAKQSRLFISSIMFKVAIILFGMQLMVAIWYYSHRPKRFLPRMPTSIASIIAFVSASRALDDFNQDDTSEDGHLKQKYAYGRFIGIDGKTHVGIERQRYVVRLKSRNPEVKRRTWGFNRRKTDDKEPRTWI